MNKLCLGQKKLYEQIIKHQFISKIHGFSLIQQGFSCILTHCQTLSMSMKKFQSFMLTNY
jgi:energy-converting hydrogenase Eha subunit C